MGTVFLIGLYLFPAFLAMALNKKHTDAIFVFNLLLGWLGLGLFWVLALVWALADEKNNKGVKNG